MIDTSNPEVAFALRAVADASHVTRLVQDGMDVRGIAKDDKSPVTVADFASQAVVARALREAFPGDSLVAEEDASGLRGDADTLAHVVRFVSAAVPGASDSDVCDWIDVGNGEPTGRFWTLDPIDGTKGYLRAEQYAVALALIENGRVALGVLGCPALGPNCSLDSEGGVLIVAKRGEGTWCATLDQPDAFRQLHVSDRTEMRDARWLRSVEKGHTNLDQMGQLAASLGVEADPVGLDSQAKYAVLAAGGGDVLLRLLSPSRPDYRERIWDQAAGSIVVEEAGGRVTDLSGKPLDFSHGVGLEENRGICATNGHLHEAMLTALAEMTPAG